MAKQASGGAKGGRTKPKQDENRAAQDDAQSAFDAIPEALRDAGRRAADLAQNPYARSLLAAGLVTAAAALAANKNVRDTAKRNLKDATDAAEAAAEIAADNAGKIGAAIINAATDAVQRMMSLSAGLAGTATEGSGDGAAGKPSQATSSAGGGGNKAEESAAPKARKPRAASGSTGGAGTGKAGKGGAAATTRKPAARKGTASKASEAKTGSTRSGTGRTRKTAGTAKTEGNQDS